MTEKNKKIKDSSELRQDIVTGDWVVIATGRARRPDAFMTKRTEAKESTDLFANPEESGQEKDVLIYQQESGEWSLRVFPNKYPVVSHGTAVKELSEGPYFAMSGIGYHEVIVTHDVDRSLGLLDVWQVAEVLDAYQERYLELMNKKSVNYVQIFHNHGKEAGASLAHPHSQLIAIPVVSPYIELELKGAESYYSRNKERVYDVMVSYEQEHKKRVLFENDHMIAFCPYASRTAFEVWIVGKRQNPYFERITDEEKFACAEALQGTLAALYQGLHDPAYNFYLHSAPCDGQEYPHYQWHIEILPHTATWAGFELSTGIEVCQIDPEVAASHLRDHFPSKTKPS